MLTRGQRYGWLEPFLPFWSCLRLCSLRGINQTTLHQNKRRQKFQFERGDDFIHLYCLYSCIFAIFIMCDNFLWLQIVISRESTSITSSEDIMSLDATYIKRFKKKSIKSKRENGALLLPRKKAGLCLHKVGPVRSYWPIHCCHACLTGINTHASAPVSPQSCGGAARNKTSTTLSADIKHRTRWSCGPLRVVPCWERAPKCQHTLQVVDVRPSLRDRLGWSSSRRSSEGVIPSCDLFKWFYSVPFF